MTYGMVRKILVVKVNLPITKHILIGKTAILVFKHDMVSLDNLEYSYHDQTMSEMGLTPSEVEITIPSFVLRDRFDEIEYWDDQMKMAKQKMGTEDVVVSFMQLLENNYLLCRRRVNEILMSPWCQSW